MGFEGNLAEERARLLARKQRIYEATAEAAQAIGDVFTANTRPLARVRTGKWRDTIHSEVTQVRDGVWDIWMGSHGCLSDDGFDYGAFWNFFDGTIDTGVFLSRPEFDQIIQGIYDSANED